MDISLQRLRRAVKRHPATGTALLACGVAAPAWWVAMDVAGSLRYPGYSYVDQTISELSAVGAPTRTFMAVASGIPYAALMIAFGMGVWAAFGERRAGRVTGAVLIGEALWGVLGGLLFPMAMRGADETLRNRVHPIYGIGMPILFLLAAGFGSRLFGRRFRCFTYVSIVVILAFGILTSLDAPKVAENEPTPWLGAIERTNAYAAMLWIAVLAVGLLRAQGVAIRRPATTSRRLERLPH